MGRSSDDDRATYGEPLAILPIHDSGRIVMLHGDIDEATMANVIGQMMTLAQVSHDPIYLVISTYGGSIDEMFSLYDLIRFLPCPVYTIGLGKIMSAGVLLLASGQKGKRLLGNTARIMMHPVSGTAYGNVFENMTQVDELKRMHKLYVKSLSRELGVTKRDINRIMKKGSDYFLTPKKAIKLGIVDKILQKQV